MMSGAEKGKRETVDTDDENRMCLPGVIEK